MRIDTGKLPGKTRLINKAKLGKVSRVAAKETLQISNEVFFLDRAIPWVSKRMQKAWRKLALFTRDKAWPVAKKVGRGTCILGSTAGGGYLGYTLVPFATASSPVWPVVSIGGLGLVFGRYGHVILKHLGWK